MRHLVASPRSRSAEPGRSKPPQADRAGDAVLNLLTNDSVTLNYTAASVSGNSRATMKRTDNAAITDVIPTRLCGLTGCSSNSEVQISKAYTWSGNTLLGLLGSKQYSIPLYFRTVAGQNVTAGPYQVLLTFSINYSVCSVGVLGLCTVPQTGTATTSILLNMTVTNDCSAMTTPDVNFNSAPLVPKFPHCLAGDCRHLYQRKHLHYRN